MASYDIPVYVISVAAQRAGMHAQTLRTYDRLGLVVPRRTSGRGRRYSERDIDKLREVQRLSNAGINLAGVARIFELVEENERLRAHLLARYGLAGSTRVFTATPSGDIKAPVTLSPTRGQPATNWRRRPIPANRLLPGAPAAAPRNLQARRESS